MCLATLAGQGECAEALSDLGLALNADPADATALGEGRKARGKHAAASQTAPVG